MAMPEATVNENNSSVARKNQIRLSGHVARRKAVSKSETMKMPTNQHFRRGVARTNGGHHARSDFWGDNIDQGAHLSVLGSKKGTPNCTACRNPTTKVVRQLPM